MGKMSNLVFVCFGFFSALTFHSVWGRVAAAIVGIFIAVKLVLTMKSSVRFVFLLVFPVMCFLLATYAGNGFNNWLTENTPELVLGDVVYYFREAGVAASPAVSGAKELISTGNPDSFASEGMKVHYFLMLFVSLSGAFVLCINDNKHKVPEAIRQRKNRKNKES